MFEKKVREEINRKCESTESDLEKKKASLTVARLRLLDVSIEDDISQSQNNFEENLELGEDFNSKSDVATPDGVIKNAQSLEVSVEIPERTFEDKNLAFFEEKRADHFTNIFRYKNFKKENPKSKVDKEFERSMIGSYYQMNQAKIQCLDDLEQEVLNLYQEDLKTGNKEKSLRLKNKLAEIQERKRFIEEDLKKIKTHLELTDDMGESLAQEIYRATVFWDNYEIDKNLDQGERLADDLKEANGYSEKEALIMEKAKEDLNKIEESLKDLFYRIQEEKPDKVVFLDTSARVFAQPFQKRLSEDSQAHPELHKPQLEFFNDSPLKNNENPDYQKHFERFKGVKVLFVDEYFSNGRGANNILAAKRILGEDFSYSALASASGDSLVDRAKLDDNDPAVKIYPNKIGHGAIFSELIEDTELKHVQKSESGIGDEIVISRSKDARSLARKFQEEIYKRILDI